LSEGLKFTFTESPPKNGRLDSYQKILSTILNEKSVDVTKLQEFMKRIFDDCMDYLKKSVHLNFPVNAMVLKIVFNKEEYAAIFRKYDRICGARPFTKAFCIIDRGTAWIYIDFQSHFFISSGTDFIANLTMSYLEELVHVAFFPNPSESDIHELLCSAIEGFLEITLPNIAKEARLDYAHKCDE
jgi:hypothetical protein